MTIAAEVMRHQGARVGRSLLLGASLLLLSISAEARPPLASIVIDAGSGRVLEAHHAEAPRYPASLTKLMTLYLVFGALKTHHLTLEHRFRVSKLAASREPTRLGLRPGSWISVRNIILGLVTQSANDAASVIAEGIAGSEKAFAVRMTRKAHQLGMLHTVFRNASGLPKPPNVTTARDMATLARALIRDFPSRYRYFSVRKFRYKGRRYFNHNHLMSRYKGMDGMKTGYIHASGFNLVASAVRDGRRLIGVVMGGRSSHSRDLKMAALLDKGFASPSPSIQVAHTETSGSRLASNAARALAALSPIGRAEAAPRAEHTDRNRKKNPHPSWSIQLGAFARRGNARRLANKVMDRQPSLSRRKQHIVALHHKHGRVLYVVRFVHFKRATAKRTCAALHREHYQCLVLKSSG